MGTMHVALITAALFAAAVVVCACIGDIGEPVETVIVQDSGVSADADADTDASAPLVGFPAGTSGAGCTKSTDCKSDVCFMGGKSSYCSLPCSAANAMTACAAAPFNGVCNMQGFCRLP
jgi:hypothetical protein